MLWRARRQGSYGVHRDLRMALRVSMMACSLFVACGRRTHCFALFRLFSITSNSRMYYAFARDGGLPKFFAKVEPRLWSSPVRAIWLAVFLSFILALPALGSTVAYAAATSIATIGLCKSIVSGFRISSTVFRRLLSALLLDLFITAVDHSLL